MDTNPSGLVLVGAICRLKEKPHKLRIATHTGPRLGRTVGGIVANFGIFWWERLCQCPIGARLCASKIRDRSCMQVLEKIVPTTKTTVRNT